MLGVILLYVGFVLTSNGIAALAGIDDKSKAVMNIFAGVISFALNMCCIFTTIINDGDPMNYYACATGLLFAFTYFFSAINTIWNLDWRMYGWFCLFVTIVTVPTGALCFMNFGGSPVMGIIWWLWGALWLTGFIEFNLKKSLGKFTGAFFVFDGIVTGGIPGYLMLIGQWPF